MLLILLAGIWALAFGRIAITSRLRLDGRPARLYGLTLISAAVLLFLLSPLLQRALPLSLVMNGAAMLAISLVINIAIILGLLIPFRKSAEKTAAASAPPADGSSLGLQ